MPLADDRVSMSAESDRQEVDTREEIMHATYRALCEHGYASLSMQDIADELDKSRSLLHYHYDTREELLLAFVDHLVGWIGDRLEETDTRDPRLQLLEYVDRFVGALDDEEGRRFVTALFELRLQAVHNEAFRERLAAHYRSNVEAAATVIEDGVEAGVFHPVDPEPTAEGIYNAIEGARMYEVILGAEGAADRMREALLTYVLSDLVVVPAVLDGEHAARFEDSA
jgi:AcrR family transcriptional regulator